ncbi:hypothetical protein SEA_CASSEROLE_26 [Arthrobacter phage Casserole]|nr:hypothetical protein SEA_CASSEROLE_26 [Arthrobacter phage Casserole]
MAEKSWWDELWGGWNGMWGDFSENEKKRTESNMAKFHDRPDYKQNVANRKAQEAAKTQQPSTPSYPTPPRASMDGGRHVPKTTAAPMAETQAPNKLQMILDQIGSLLNADPEQEAQGMLAQVRSTFDGARGTLNGVRGRTNENFETSNKNIGDLYQSGRNETLQANNILQNNSNSLVTGLNGLYDGNNETLSNERDEAMAKRAEMLQRMGIQEAGMGDAGSVQSNAIEQNASNKGGAVQQALTYGASDVTTNTARANSLISEGSARQSELRNQLTQILGQLDMKEAELGTQQQQAEMEARQAAGESSNARLKELLATLESQQGMDWDREKFYTQLAADQAQNEMRYGGQSQDAFNLEDANNYVSQNGGDAGKANSAYTDAIINYQDPTGGSAPNPSESYIAKKLVEQGLDPNLALAYARIASEKSKYNSVSVG